MKTDPRRGIVLVLLAAALWGTTGTAQALAGATLAPSWFAALRLAVAALFFVALNVCLRRRSGPEADTSTSMTGFALAGLCMAAYNLAFFAGIRLTGVALGTALALGSGPVWTGLLQALALRRWPTTKWWCGTGLAVAGGALMTGVGRHGPVAVDLFGVTLCLLAGLAYAVYALAAQRLGSSMSAPSVTLRAFCIATAIAVPFAWADAGAPALSAADAAALLYVGVVTAGVAYLLFGMALRHVSAATGVTLALLEPVVACVLAAVFIGEAVDAPAWLGLALVMGGVSLVVRAELRGRADELSQARRRSALAPMLRSRRNA